MDNYKVEHPDYDDDLSPYFKQLQVIEWFRPGVCYNRWVDCSWHNNTCPCVCMALKSLESELTIWFDYKDPNNGQHADSRAEGTMRRFSLMTENQTVLCETDDWNEMFQFVTDLTSKIPGEMG